MVHSKRLTGSRGLRRFAAIGAAVTALTVIAACGSSGSGGSGSTADSDLAKAFGEKNVDQFQKLYDEVQKSGQTQLVIWDAASVPNQSLYETFMKRFPAITVNAQQVNAGDMLTKLNAEKAAGKRSADVAATGSTAMIQGAAAGNFQSYSPFTAPSQKGDPVMADPNDYFRMYKIGPKGITYNTTMAKASEIKSWNDLLNPKWKDKIAMRNPTVNGGGNELASDMLYDGRITYDWFTKLAAQNVKMVSTSAELANAVSTGQVAIGIPGDYDTYLDQKANGAPLGFVWPVEGGNELSELYIGIIADAPHKLAAQLYEAWQFSPEGVRALNKVGVYSPSEQLPDNAPEGLTPYKKVDAFKAYPISDALKYQTDIRARLKEIFKI